MYQSPQRQMQLLARVSEAAGLGQDGSQGYRCAETNDLLWAARNLTTQLPKAQTPRRR